MGTLLRMGRAGELGPRGAACAVPAICMIKSGIAPMLIAAIRVAVSFFICLSSSFQLLTQPLVLAPLADSGRIEATRGMTPIHNRLSSVWALAVVAAMNNFTLTDWKV